jgi:hypothetical protein
MDKDLLIKYIKGNATGPEREEVLAWIEADSENAGIFNSLKAEYTFNNLPNDTPPASVYKSILKKRRPHLSFSDYIIRIAAILLIPVAAYSVYQHINFTEKTDNLHNKDKNIISAVIPEQMEQTIQYCVNQGVKGEVNLPDGSRVWLNSDSRLKCPSKFDKAKRVVELDGEGYFIVVSNKAWPMYVKTSKKVTVKVTGTEFNLSSYQNDSELRFTLVSGNVTIIRENTSQEIAVRSREELIIPENGRVLLYRGEAHIPLNTSWKDGYLVFDNTPMPEVIKKMERWYGVSITVEDPQIYKYSFTANFRSESITQVLELLKITSNIKYFIDKRNVKLFL